MRLTESQISDFHEDGYLRLENVLDEEDLRPVIEEYSALIDERAQLLYAAGKVSSLYADEPFARRMACLAEEAPEVAEWRRDGLDIMQARGKGTFNFLKNPKILDLAESLVGSEIVCNPIQHIRAILPQRLTDMQPANWHQDAGVCWPEADPYFMLTIWVPIGDATLENGCLEVMPGSHKYGLFDHTRVRGAIGPAEGLPPIDPLPLPIPAGGVILFHNYTLHHAQPNESDTVRWSIDLRYNDAFQPTGRPYHPGFLMRSKLRPDPLQTDYETWCQRWEFALKASRGVGTDRWQTGKSGGSSDLSVGTDSAREKPL